ncbi:hypothetical protein KL911_002029 [Ogataea haglerorum]|uniref:uncharacterized protein n=1 Tax=Ogataea haglerorum TaxID=1937702 RepID=UPI001C8AB2CC|nr:uncharacterized protein KL911_002029 [Ogataea haglerorum]KAG7754590.1 hypothetical protein KL911_002029 [Ogataea haglerorum]
MLPTENGGVPSGSRSQTSSKRRSESFDSQLDDGGAKRRSTRVKEVPNYSLSRPRNSRAPSEINASESTVPPCLNSGATKYNLPSIDSSLPIEEQRQIAKSNMAKLVVHNESLVQELYHLENFTSLVYFKPGDPKQPDTYEQYKEEFSLWPKIDEAKLGRRSRRLTENSDPLKIEIEKIIERDRSESVPPIESLEAKKPAAKKIKEEPIKSELEPEMGDFAFESDSSEVSIPPATPTKIRRLRLKVNVRPQLVTHPSHVTSPKFGSLEEFLSSYRSTIEEPSRDLSNEEYQEYLNAQYELINKIREGLDSKLLTLDFNENVFRAFPQGSREPTMIKKNAQYSLNHYKPPTEPFRSRNELTHYDHLLAQGIRSSKLIHDLRASRISRCRRIAGMIESHFKKLSQEQERKEREFEKKIAKLARDTAKEVKKKWLVAVKAYKILEEREKERERAVKSKEQLSKILDQSTRMLGAQVGKRSVTPSSRQQSVVSEQSQSDSDDESDLDDDENMSSSSSEDNAEEGNGLVKDDSKLTVEELREKYKDLDKLSAEPDSDDDSEAEEPDTLASLYGVESNGEHKKISVVDQLTDEQKKKLLEESSNPLLDESEDTDISMSDSSESESSEEEVSSDDSQPGLASLFGNNIKEEPGEAITPPSSDEMEVDGENPAIPDVPVPILLRGTLREYQKQGLNWLASLYNTGTNGILADEMGLGKTIQTISLISYLACEKNIWGPHLIVVPTSVMLNWEMEFKRFAPGFKVLTYYGNPQQRKEKRKGWNTPDTFHVCITSYQLVVQDHSVFRRKKWRYMILDEAHNIKNFRSQRWKALLNFNTENRLLLTGTPLQNNIMELWSLLYFLMPSSKADQMMPDGFANLMDFQQWFGRPVDKIIQGGGYGGGQEDDETKETVNKLHQVLRPYLLRRLKQDVEKQMPAKYEHIVYCRLSKRQRLLYDDFMSRAQTRETLASGNFLSIINCLMQLRKVCNHPDLFEVRPILTSLAMEKNVASNSDLNELIIRKHLRRSQTPKVDLNFLNLTPAEDFTWNSFNVESLKKVSASRQFAEEIQKLEENLKPVEPNFESLTQYYEHLKYKEHAELIDLFKQRLYVNNFNCEKNPIYSSNLLDLVKFDRYSKENFNQLEELRLIQSVSTRAETMNDTIEKYAFVTPKVVTQNTLDLEIPERIQNEIRQLKLDNPFHQAQTKLAITFPDKSLLQYDCGKLQKLASLLQELIPKGHRVLIFTQMTKVLDILEKFMNYNGYKYMRLDGATKIEDRQLLTERFNKDPKIKCFILSTRSGGLGINLTGADTVIFYDSDWNPAMDKQCQDRCHRIGQTRDVHIYRFVSEYTIESNILKKANQKRQLDNVVIQEGDFTTDYFSKITVKDLFGEDSEDAPGDEKPLIANDQGKSENELAKVLEQAEDAEDAQAAEVAMKEVNLDNNDFTEDQNVLASTKSPSVVGQTRQNSAEPDDFVKRIESKEDEEEDEDDGIGHIDEYMIRFIAGGFYFD